MRIQLRQQLDQLWIVSALVRMDVHGEEELDHEPKEAYEDVGVESVLGDDLLCVGAQDSGNPGEKSMRKRFDLLAARGRWIVS